MGASIKITGLKALEKKLRHLSEKGGKRAARKAVNAGGQPILKAARREAPVETGALKKAQAKKVTGSNYQYNAIVGADINYVGEDGRKPGKYDNLVMHGHQNADGTTTPGNPYLDRAWNESIDEARELHAKKLAEEIENEAGKEA